ncbi:cbb3-type cytochrome oxidase assembly protein CcoS [Aliarcobacter butzleri]|uniref:cbb3-type cytochrome oxidase assembly protein CcoS n=1 Tax=Aliarcobacter butzleri TaxID=28197 RepID=UPI001EE12795|nr:cbb3-type cytochrome oxidase assembly protein CcoS [Aliarcobacter butzleri]MCG3704607.1 cbb3-type cytochrome oxidase assembly protein CcoS [Aliarcobacter butzleri]MCT7615309.1 cbb3-type cytochrome oxidase assembly protein CcoS [Aliarcobacter butzleri]MDS1369765.1 cbb3-type cytochrome oxidase assembly protein CcoS [Aliarcobacter butzleri]
MINDTLLFMLIVGIIISAGLLLLFVWAAKTGQFDDADRMLNNPLYDSVDDLNDAIRKEQKIKEEKEAKEEKEKKE